MSDSKKPIDEPTGTETTGHVWDGIQELNTPLPRWWLYLFYATVVWAAVYMVLYPSIPLLERAWPGLLGYSSRGQVEEELVRVAAGREELNVRIANASFEEIQADPVLFDYARRSGESAFKLVCVQCHGSGLEGSQELGYPNLNDDDWLWGGTTEAIYHSITHGIRNTEDPAARSSAMPAYGATGMLSRREISDVSHYVLSLSMAEHDEEAAARGEQTYATQCAACHGPTGDGNELLGAPRLNDPIWLYGGTHAQIMEQVANPRLGVMPPWGDHFDEATRKKLTLYIHSRGGGQ